jgi:DNA primase
MGTSSYDFAIEEIKRRLSIVDLIGTYISLKRSGRTYTGLCPFHDDKNPSMQVNDEKGLYHCFSCGAGGDIFSFLVNYRNLTFKEALEELAQKLNITLSNDKTTKQKSSNRSNLLKVNNLALSFFHKNLIKNKNSAVARKYLAGRGITSEIAKEFRLGYANEGWDNLFKIFNDKGVPHQFAAEIGLIVRKDGKNEYYDRFRHRIMFPIVDVNGDIIGFGGRVVNETDKPKYLNSPESALYKKRSSFYGLFNSIEHIKKLGRAILVEGYIDFLSLYCGGIKNVVATLGTSLTPEHARILKRYTKNVVILYDGDESGIKATLRTGEILLQAGINPRLVILPDGSDPDRYITDNGSDKLSGLIESSEELVEYYINKMSGEFNSGRYSRSELADNLVEFAMKINNPVERSHYIKQCSNTFGFRENDIHSLLNAGSGRRAATGKTGSNKIEEGDNYELLILKICFKYPELLSGYKSEFINHYINDPNIKEIVQKSFSGEYKDVNSLINSISDPDSQSLISKAVFSSEEIEDSNSAEKMLTECINRLKLRKVKEQLLDKRSQIQLLKTDSDFDTEKRLLEDYRNLIQEEKQIKSELHNA